MNIQIIAPCRFRDGTSHHALMLARAFTQTGHTVLLLNVQTSTASNDSAERGISCRDVPPDQVAPADLNVVVGLWDEGTIGCAVRLLGERSSVILVPTIYWPKNMVWDLPGQADAIWYVSRDQALRACEYWCLARRIEIVRCAVDTTVFSRSSRQPTGRPWVLGRHSRDVPEKFSSDTLEFVRAVGKKNDIVYRMLGAAGTLGLVSDRRIETYHQDCLEPADFLRQCDIWVYAHAPYWKETACIAMLEAMSVGLPVVVNNCGGMREYVQHGQTGFVCNEAEDFVRAVELLLGNAALYQEVGSAASTFICNYHSIDALAKQVRAGLS